MNSDKPTGGTRDEIILSKAYELDFNILPKGHSTKAMTNEDRQSGEESEPRRTSSLARDARDYALQIVLANSSNGDAESIDQDDFIKQLYKAETTNAKENQQKVDPNPKDGTNHHLSAPSFATEKTTEKQLTTNEEKEKDFVSSDYEMLKQNESLGPHMNAISRSRTSVLADQTRQRLISRVLQEARSNSFDSQESTSNPYSELQKHQPSSQDRIMSLKRHSLGLSTGQNVSNNHIDSIPGAFRVRPRNQQLSQQNATTFSSASLQTTNAATHQNVDEELGQQNNDENNRDGSVALISATVVDDPNDENKMILAQAKVVNSARARRFKILRICIGIILMIMVVAMAITLTRERQSSSDVVPISEAPSGAPTLSPSFSPMSILSIIEAQYVPERNKLLGVELLTTNGTPQNRSLDWMISHEKGSSDLLNTYTPEKILQRYSLGVFFFALEGNSWLNREKWLDINVDECDWFMGSTGNPCDGDGMLKSIVLRQNALQGRLPYNEMTLMPQLELVDLGANEIDGVLPAPLGKLQRLKSLTLSSNAIRGTFPPSWSELRSLTVLELESNSFSCLSTCNSCDRQLFDPSWANLTNLRVLSLRDNPLGMDHNCHLPTEIGQMSSLQKLILDGTQLYGTLPTEVGRLTDLAQITFPTNVHASILSSEIGQLTRLGALNLRGATFSSRSFIPPEIGHLTMLTTLDISSPFQNNMGIGGNLPSQLGMLTRLRQLILAESNIRGLIPSEIGNLQGLIELDLSNMSLVGTIPTTIGQLGPLLRHLDFANDVGLFGTLPSSVVSMTRLTHLDLSRTSLRGSLPEGFNENLTSLQLLRLTDTQLTGDIEALACREGGNRRLMFPILLGTAKGIKCSCCERE